MSPSKRGRTIATVILVVCVLSTAWAAYYLYSEVHPANGGAGTTLATFTESGTNSFVASLSPSYLYNNSTVVYGGNVTLFTPITNWINVTSVYAFSANRSVAYSLNGTFSVVLSTPVWTKTLYSSTNQTSRGSGGVVTIVNRFAVNVSAVVALATAIDRQIGYTGPSFSLTLLPHVSGDVSVGATVQPVSAEPTLNFTFEGSLISPSGLEYLSSGEVVQPNSGAPAPGAVADAVPLAALATSAGGLGGSLWYVSRRPEEKVLLPLDQLIAPYEEAIAATQPVVGPSGAIRVDDFSDLVKIADTLGKPILRPTGGPAEGDAEFLVLDGDVAYSYRYPSSSVPSPAPSSPMSRTASQAPAGWTTPPSTSSQRRLIRNLRQELYRLQGMPIDHRTANQIRSLTANIVDAVRADDEGEAAVKVDELTRLIDRVAYRHARSTSPGGRAR